MNVQEKVTSYNVWDRSTRIFHWVNALCVISLMAVGIVIINAKTLGIEGEAKILLKTVHVYIGFVFVANLLWRIIWGFAGNHYARWKTILPFNKNYLAELRDYLKHFNSETSKHYLGHNPAARLMVTVLFILLGFQAITGLILAGTDLYLPPFGHEFKEIVMNAGEDHSKIVDVVPGRKDNLDPEGYQRMREIRKPFIEIHEFSFYVLLVAIIIHIIGVVVTEIKEGDSIVSAMITGKKRMKTPPVDYPHDNTKSS